MVNKNSKKTIIVVSILLLSLIGGTLYLNTQQQELSFNSVYLPNYVSIWCGRLPAKATTNILLDGHETIESTCGSNGLGNPIDAYTPNGCNYIADNNILTYKVVDQDTACDWRWYETGNTFTKNTPIHIGYLKKICIKSYYFSGKLNVLGTATAYGLHVNNANGKVVFSKNCDLKSNIKNIKNIDYIPGFSTTPFNLKPDNSVNHYIVGFSPVANSKDVVMHNGNMIYINAIGSYYPIIKSANGYYYANSLTPIHDSKIICIPSSNFMCIDGYTIQTKNQPCSMFNKAEGYVSIGNNLECEYSCVNGHSKKEKCRQKATCSGETPWRNPITNKCEMAGQQTIQKDIQCGWNQESYKEVNYNYGALNWRQWTPFVSPIKNDISGCRTAGWFYALIVSLFLLIALAIVKFVPTSNTNKQ